MTVKELLSKASPCAEILRVTAGPGAVVVMGGVVVSTGMPVMASVVEGTNTVVVGIGVCD